jgi:hypothetical protein
MAEYVTSVLEITEAGVPIRAEGDHVVKVLGAVKQLNIPDQSGSKEAQVATTSDALVKYLAGELQPPPPDAGASDEPFQVPEAIVLASGDIGFLKRGGGA